VHSLLAAERIASCSGVLSTSTSSPSRRTVPAADGKLTPALIDEALIQHEREHTMMPNAVSLIRWPIRLGCREGSAAVPRGVCASSYKEKERFS
jgi:hypothetical protein